MGKKRRNFLIQYVSLALGAIVFLGSGLTKAAAYGAELAAVSTEQEVITEESCYSERPDEKVERTLLNRQLTDFSVRLFQQTLKNDGNTLISPYSIVSALSMTANGASGNTLSKMEEVLGVSSEELKEYLYAMEAGFASDEEKALLTANSLWLKEEDSLQFQPDFLKTAKEWYDAEAASVPMDAATLQRINHWVNEKTDGMIPEILDEIPKDAVMYLINALAFHGAWEEEYPESAVSKGTFTREDGSTQEADMMYSEESAYLEDEGAVGFLKNYKNGKYAFAALLPDEGTTVEAYAKSLTGERLCRVLSNVQSESIDAAIPCFQAEYSIELSDSLKELGMEEAFSPKDADFSKMCVSEKGNIYIGRVLHKTYIDVNPKGTEAAAATAVEMLEECALEPVPMKIIHLDRPFVYFLIDLESGFPLFMGTVHTLES